MLILVINCGSSSVKYDLFNVEKECSLCRGSVERIGEEDSVLTYETSAGDDRYKTEENVLCLDHHKAIEIIRDTITGKDKGALTDVNEVAGVGHRVVHGGEEFSGSTLIGDKVLRSIEKFSTLAPLHNPPALEGIRGCMKIFNSVPQVAVFDTAFHQSMEEHVFCYGIPYEFYKKYGIRKYGFHGTSHKYVFEKTAEILERPSQDLNVITVHLGNGCSVAAIRGGKCVDTSMGFTPLEGLVMGTRSGDIDPAIVAFLADVENLNASEVVDVLNKKSGLLGVSGVSNDMRDLLKAIDKGNARAKLAYDIFVYRIKKYIGSYAAVLGNVDAVVFTAGIGENAPQIKEDISEAMRSLLGNETEFMIVPTNEEFLIAKDTYEVVKQL